MRAKKLGYASTASTTFLASLKSLDNSSGWNTHARALGDVVYIMCAPTTHADTLVELRKTIVRALGGRELDIEEAAASSILSRAAEENAL